MKRRYMLFGLMGVTTALALPASSSAEVTSNERVPFAGTGLSCSGEPIPVEGTAHVVSWDDGGYHTNAHSTGVTPSGDEHVITRVEHGIQQTEGNGATVIHQMQSRHQIRTGRSEPEDDAHYHETVHVVITPNGDLVVSRGVQDFGCR